MHQAVVEHRAWRPWKPDERYICQVPQAELFDFGERMSLGCRQLDTLCGNRKLVQVPIGCWHEVDEPRIQATGPYSLYLLHAGRWPKLEFGVGLQLTKPPEGLRHNAAPARILGFLCGLLFSLIHPETILALFPVQLSAFCFLLSTLRIPEAAR